MKNLLTVLKKLGKKMTSQDINGTNLVTVVDDIANKYTGGSSGGGGGGGEGVVIVDFTYEEVESTSYYHSSLTIGEMLDLLESGKVLIGCYVDQYDLHQYWELSSYEHSYVNEIQFKQVFAGGNNTIIINTISTQMPGPADSNVFVLNTVTINGVEN